MNNPFRKSEKNISGSEFDALIVPAADINNLELEVSFFDQHIPCFDIDSNLPAESPTSPTGDDTPVVFELLPDFSLDRSQRHYEVAPPQRTNGSSETGIFPSHHQCDDKNPTLKDDPSPQSPPYYPFSPGIAANAPSDNISNLETLHAAILKLVQSIPLLNEEDLLASLAESHHGGLIISPKTLKQALSHIGLDTDYKRYRAYITG